MLLHGSVIVSPVPRPDRRALVLARLAGFSSIQIRGRLLDHASRCRHGCAVARGLIGVEETCWVGTLLCEALERS